MRDSFIFYKSFMDAIDTIPQIKYKYLLLESIIKLGLFSEESEEKLIGFCIETEQKLSKNLQVLGLFFAIKPQLIANYKKYLNGCKGSKYGSLGGEFGKLGGRPKKPPKNPPNENDKCIMNNENVFNDVGGKEKNKKSDPYISNTKQIFISEYEKIFKTKPFLSANDCIRLNTLSASYDNFPELIVKSLTKLKAIEFKDIDFTPSASWLLRGENFERVMNGEFDKKQKEKTWQELLAEKAAAKGVNIDT